MPFVKKIAVFLWEFVVEEASKLLRIAIKSLYNAPVFYGIIWLVSHHAPSHDMWVSFFLGALFFTSFSKKANSRPNKEEPQRPPSPIILPASLRHGSDDFRV
jgi:hypothetical protein